MTPPPDRLDSWKAIAAYLRRDERTVRRWEKTLGLPVRRVPGTRGSSVFAYVEEIESWLKKTQETIPEAMAAPETTTPETVDRPRALERGPAVRWMAAGFAAIVLAVVAWQLMPRASAGPLRFRVTPDAVIAADASATERWRYAFAAGEQAYLPDGLPWSATGDGSTGVVVLLGNRQRPTDKRNLGGLLLSLSGSGELRWQLGLDDQIEIERTTYGPPWMFPNFTSEVQNGSQRIAIAAHHEIWWPGLAVTLDAQGKRTGRFVNAGWIEDVHWMPGNRLLVNGYAEHLGGMLAALDASAMNGHSPAPPGGTFACNGCGTDMPLRYVAFPASELNRVTGSRFNRTRVTIADDRVIARTEEIVMPDQSIVDALYELSPTLEPLRASFSDRYWDLHRSLELEGRIHHNRANCPDRDGPQRMEVWDPNTGWKSVRLPEGPVR